MSEENGREDLYVLVDITSREGAGFLRRAPLKNILLWAKIYKAAGIPTARLDLIENLPTLQYLYWNTAELTPPDSLEAAIDMCAELATNLEVDHTSLEELNNQLSETQKENKMGQGAKVSGTLEKGSKKKATASTESKKKGDNGKEESTKPAKEVKEAKPKKEPKVKEPRDLTKSNKAQVFLAYVGGERDLAKLSKKAKGEVKETTIKSWVGSWLRGENLPACATAENKKELQRLGKEVAKQREADRKAKAKDVEKKAAKMKKAAEAEAAEDDEEETEDGEEETSDDSSDDSDDTDTDSDEDDEDNDEDEGEEE
jgi:hypothetical protein